MQPLLLPVGESPTKTIQAGPLSIFVQSRFIHFDFVNVNDTHASNTVIRFIEIRAIIVGPFSTTSNKNIRINH
jgi:hypothetical protein